MRRSDRRRAPRSRSSSPDELASAAHAAVVRPRPRPRRTPRPRASTAVAATPSTAPGMTAVPDDARAQGVRAYHAAMRASSARHAGRDVLRSRRGRRARRRPARRCAYAGRWVDDAIAIAHRARRDHALHALRRHDGGARRGVLRSATRSRGAGVFEPARAYFRARARAERRVGRSRDSTRGSAVRRLVEIAITEDEPRAGLDDLEGRAAAARRQTRRASSTYLRGRRARRRGRSRTARSPRTRRSPRRRASGRRPTYLSGSHPRGERGSYAEAEALFCKVADPKRQDTVDAGLRRREVLRGARSRAPRARPHRARAVPLRRLALLLLPRAARLRAARRGALRSGDDALREEGLRGRARAARRSHGARARTTATRTRR